MPQTNSPTAPETIKYLTTKEVEKLLSSVQDPRDKALFTMMYYLGLRCIEASNLTINHIRLEDSRVFIKAAKNGISGEHLLTKEIKKTIKNYLPEREKKLTKMRLDTNALFVSKKGGKLSTRQIQRLFYTYCQKARIKDKTKYHPHTLRHSIAVHMADSGTPVEVVQIHLRHRKIDNTMIYFQITSKIRHQLQEKALAGIWVARL